MTYDRLKLNRDMCIPYRALEYHDGNSIYFYLQVTIHIEVRFTLVLFINKSNVLQICNFQYRSNYKLAFVQLFYILHMHVSSIDG